MRKLFIILVSFTVGALGLYAAYRGYRVWKQQHLLAMARQFYANSDNRSANPIAAAFESFSDRKNSETDTSATSGGNVPRGRFQNMRITADAANNSVVVYSNQEDYRVVERAIRDIDRPQLQVSIDATWMRGI